MTRGFHWVNEVPTTANAAGVATDGEQHRAHDTASDALRRPLRALASARTLFRWPDGQSSTGRGGA